MPAPGGTANSWLARMDVTRLSPSSPVVASPSVSAEGLPEDHPAGRVSHAVAPERHRERAVDPGVAERVPRAVVATPRLGGVDQPGGHAHPLVLGRGLDEVDEQPGGAELRLALPP